jgi:hypothetical protein
MRTRAWIGAFTVMAVALVGCGSGGDSTETSGSATTTEQPTTASTQEATATTQDVDADRNAAQAALLTLSDMPTGWTSSPHDDSPGAPTLHRDLAKCLDLTEDELGLLGDDDASADSPDFSSGDEDAEVQASVGLAATAADAERTMAIAAGPKMPQCLRQAMATQIRYSLAHPDKPGDTIPKGLKVEEPEASPLSFPTLGDQTVAIRIKIPMSYATIQLDVTGDLIFIQRGRAGATLTFLGFGSPFPTELETQLARTQADRLPATQAS